MRREERRQRYGLVAALLVAAPVLVGTVYSAAAALDAAGLGAGGPSLARIERVLGEQVVWRSALFSAWIAGAATLLASAGAVVLAATFRGRGRGLDRAARALAIVPLPVPHLVAAACAVLVLGQSGLLARLGVTVGVLDAPADMPALVYDRAGLGLILALTWKELPFLALVAFSVLATRGEQLEEAARTLGAGPREVLRRVTLPLLWRGMLPAAVSVFAFALGSYETAVLLAPSDPTALPLLVAERYADASLERRADAFVLALLALGLAALAVGAHEWARARRESLER